ncbi:hypothetical protein QAD02_007525 [Eretmocerus hayati]|uniref:Uncharacterized protein n=1 Tax=Eretmocerus hayati TaxID=131215 RepID=A0ACC2N4H8_9HYME|nr:hypothetical protein QAD02_007525 [Eretmocerus hayati]
MRKDYFGYYVDEHCIFGVHRLIGDLCPFLYPVQFLQPFLAARTVYLVKDILESGDLGCEGFTTLEQHQAAWKWFQNLNEINEMYLRDAAIGQFELQDKAVLIKLEPEELDVI